MPGWSLYRCSWIYFNSLFTILIKIEKTINKHDDIPSANINMLIIWALFINFSNIYFFWIDIRNCSILLKYFYYRNVNLSNCCLLVNLLSGRETFTAYNIKLCRLKRLFSLWWNFSIVPKNIVMTFKFQCNRKGKIYTGKKCLGNLLSILTRRALREIRTYTPGAF